MLNIRTILHPTDFSPLSETAFHLASSLARDHGGRLIVLHVEEPTASPILESGMPPPEPAEDLGELQKRLEQMQPEPRVPIEWHVVEGSPVDEIIAAALKTRCDLIVLGTHGRSGLRHLLMGSVAERVVRQAPCAVLTVRSHARLPAGCEREAADAGSCRPVAAQQA